MHNDNHSKKSWQPPEDAHLHSLHITRGDNTMMYARKQGNLPTMGLSACNLDGGWWHVCIAGSRQLVTTWLLCGANIQNKGPCSCQAAYRNQRTCGNKAVTPHARVQREYEEMTCISSKCAEDCTVADELRCSHKRITVHLHQRRQALASTTAS